MLDYRAFTPKNFAEILVPPAKNPRQLKRAGMHRLVGHSSACRQTKG